jgi:hypothetical protein
VEALPDSHIYQFVWALEDSGADEGARTTGGMVAVPQIDVQARFLAQLYIDNGKGFDEATSWRAWLPINDEVHCEVINNLDLGAAQRLRLDISDRPGGLEFFHLRLLDRDGKQVWLWSGDWGDEINLVDVEILQSNGNNGGRLIRVLSRDPQICFKGSSSWRQAVSAEISLTNPVRYLDAAFIRAEEKYCARFNELNQQISEINTKLESMHDGAAVAFVRRVVERWRRKRLDSGAKIK